MIEDGRIPGIWWISDEPDNKVPGDLLINDGRLELNGSFQPLQPGAYDVRIPGLIRPVQEKTILGLSRNGNKRYTLEYYDNPAFQMSWSSYNDYKVDTYSIGRIFEGYHFGEIEGLKFKEYYVEYPNVFDWVGDGIITITTTIPQKRKKLEKSTVVNKIEVRSPKDILAYKGDGFKLSFNIYRGPFQMSPSENIHVSQGCNVKLESAKGIDLHAAQEIYRHVRRLLSIAIGIDIEPKSIRITVGRGKQKKYITMIVPGVINKKKAKTRHQGEMNFTYRDIRKQSQAIFEEWFRMKDKHSDMLDLFSSINSNSPKNINNYFKDVVSALEGYVCVETNRLEVGPDKAVKILDEALPEPDRIINKNERERIRITRNKLSHIKIPAHNESYVMDYNDKYIYANKMVFLLEYSLLKNLGVGDELLKNFYNKRKLYF